MRVLFEIVLFLILVLALGYVATRLFPYYFGRDKSDPKGGNDTKQGEG